MTVSLKEDIQRAAGVLKVYGAKEVYIFGSATRDTLRENSDIDIAVSGLPDDVFYRAMGDVEEVLQRPVDLVELSDNTPFTRYLKECGTLLRVA